MEQSDVQILDNRYELRRHVARGGMADVWESYDQRLDRTVAVKILIAELSSDASFVERFRREAMAAANLRHPNIVNVYDWGQADNTYYIVMEYIDGRSLAAIIRDEAPLAPERSAGICGEVANALSAAHKQGMVHRDIKPGNILIDSDGMVKVADFGIARAIGASEGLTQVGAVMGTATYFSPEQAQGRELDGRSDVYSLGCVLYECLTGRPPFDGETPVAIAYKHVGEEAVPPRRRNPAVPPALDAIVMKCLAKQPGHRYETAEALRADLIRFRKNLPIAAQAEASAAAASATTAMPATAMVAQTAAAPAGGHDDDDAEEPWYLRTGFFVGLLCVMLLILAGVVFFGAKSLGWGDGNGSAQQVEVPLGLEGLQEADAVQKLSDVDLEAKIEYDANNEAEDGTVISTDPAGGTKVDKSSTVTLRVSGGEDMTDVPNVVGQPYEDAASLLQRAGFQVQRIDEASDTVAAGSVISQTPAPPQQAPRDSTIVLKVSSGPAPVQVPDVRNKSQAEAANELGQAGFRVSVQQEPSDSVPDGQVIRTDPPTGTSVARGTTVTIYVSSGTAQVTVPNLLGKTQSEASSALTAVGLAMDTQFVLTTDPTEDGKVISQNPSSGQRLDPGATVTVQIGTFAP